MITEMQKTSEFRHSFIAQQCPRECSHRVAWTLGRHTKAFADEKVAKKARMRELKQ